MTNRSMDSDVLFSTGSLFVYKLWLGIGTL